MLIQDDEDGTQTQQGEGDDTAEFSGAWDEQDAAERGQPEETPGRTDEAGEGEDRGGDEAEQGPEGTSSDASAADQASGEEVSDDPWANADPRLRELYEQAEARARSSAGRAGQLAKELKEIRAAVVDQRDASNATAKGEESTDEEERFQQLREEYPELAAPIIDRMVKMETEFRELKTATTAKAEADANADLDSILAEQPKLLADRHSDWQQVVTSPEFVAWRSDPSIEPFVRRIILEENAEQIVNAAECALVLDLFKAGREEGQEAVKELDQRRAKQLQAGSMPTTRTPAVTRDQPESFDAEWDRLEARDRQRSYGRR